MLHRSEGRKAFYEVSSDQTVLISKLRMEGKYLQNVLRFQRPTQSKERFKFYAFLRRNRWHSISCRTTTFSSGIFKERIMPEF